MREGSWGEGQRFQTKRLTSRCPGASSVVELLSRTVNQTLRGEIDTKVANAVGYLSSVILRAREQGELEERLTKLEEALESVHTKARPVSCSGGRA